MFNSSACCLCSGDSPALTPRLTTAIQICTKLLARGALGRKRLLGRGTRLPRQFCEAGSLLAPPRRGNDMIESLTATCRKKVIGEAATREELDDCRALDEDIDMVVTASNSVAFSLSMIVELATTVSGMRLSTRSSGSSLEQDETNDVRPEMNVSHSQRRYTSGSWRCRRSVLSFGRRSLRCPD